MPENEIVHVPELWERRNDTGGVTVDLGAGENPDSRATLSSDVRPVADLQFDVDGFWPLDDRSVDGLIARHVFEHIEDPGHFFDEAHRVLRPWGWLEITVPIGKNALADDDHKRVWQWSTPEHYCRRARRGWDVDSRLLLVRKRVDPVLHGFLAPLNPLFRILAKVSPGEATYRASAGELTARYCKA